MDWMDGWIGAQEAAKTGPPQGPPEHPQTKKDLPGKGAYGPQMLSLCAFGILGSAFGIVQK